MRGKDWNGKQPVLALLKLGLRMIFYLPQGVNTNSDFVEKDVETLLWLQVGASNVGCAIKQT